MTHSVRPLVGIQGVHVGQLVVDNSVQNENKSLLRRWKEQGVKTLRAQLMVVEVEMVQVQSLLQIRHLSGGSEWSSKYVVVVVVVDL